MVNGYVLMESLRRGELEEAVAAGARALVRAYYENYTDATQLEDGAITDLDKVLEWSPFGHDINEIVVEAERAINAEGGVRSDTDGTRHLVCTKDAWNEVDCHAARTGEGYWTCDVPGGCPDCRRLAIELDDKATLDTWKGQTR